MANIFMLECSIYIFLWEQKCRQMALQFFALLSLFDIVRPLVAKLGVDHDKRAVLHHILIGKDQKAKAKLK